MLPGRSASNSTKPYPPRNQRVDSVCYSSALKLLNSREPKERTILGMAPPPDDAPIPTYRIDLSLPPAERYVKLAKDFASEMQAMTSLLDEVLHLVIPWLWLRKLVEWLASIFLCRVHSVEETEELKGIAKASGVDLYFLIALNVLLDSLLGCTSGGVMVRLFCSGIPLISTV